MKNTQKDIDGIVEKAVVASGQTAAEKVAAVIDTRTYDSLEVAVIVDLVEARTATPKY